MAVVAIEMTTTPSGTRSMFKIAAYSAGRDTAPAPAAEVIDAEPLPPLSQGPPAGDEVVL